jgi:predicted nucleotidyltransferase
MRGASLDTTDETLRAYVMGLVDELRSELRDGLSAVILHGSLATGTFHAPKSDVDLLVLVEDLTADQASRLYSLFERHHSRRLYAGGLEVSVIRAADAISPKQSAHGSSPITLPELGLAADDPRKAGVGRSLAPRAAYRISGSYALPVWNSESRSNTFLQPGCVA